MKIILCLLLLTGSVLAQTTTNLVFKVTTEVVTAGVTNSSNTTVNYTYSVAKDKLRIDGLSYAYFQARSTNGPGALSFTNSFDNFLAKQWIKTNADAWANEKMRMDAEVTLRKITSLLTANLDLLTAGDLANLATISAKAP